MTIAEQVAGHLRGEMLRGRWREVLPGSRQLSQELGVNIKTVEVAMRQLEHEGVLAGQGAGRKRRIVVPEGKAAHPLRVGILLYQASDRRLALIVELQHMLTKAGHATVFPAKTLVDIEMDVKRVERLVEQTAADVWLVLAGSREVLQWFCTRPQPVFALYGRRSGLPIAGTGPDILTPFVVGVRRLLELGHRRIVVICRSERRKPTLGNAERAFFDELAAQGIAPGPYHLPEWEETPEGLQELLGSLFRVTPPTALIFDEAPLFAATQQFLARRSIQVPEDVSLFCTVDDPTFEWCVPSVACIRWDSRPGIRRIVRWASNVSRGKEDRRQTLTAAEFFPGGTIAWVK